MRYGGMINCSIVNGTVPSSVIIAKVVSKFKSDKKKFVNNDCCTSPNVWKSNVHKVIAFLLKQKTVWI